MDPDTAFTELLNALHERDWQRVEEGATSLLDWLGKRGLPPVTLGSWSLGQEWHRTLATFICHAALTKVKDAQRRRARKKGA